MSWSTLRIRLRGGGEVGVRVVVVGRDIGKAREERRSIDSESDSAGVAIGTRTLGTCLGWNDEMGVG
jgi:hypothetical protein